MPASEVNWYANDVLLVVDEATDDLLTRLAFQGEGYAKIDAPVDTGFMRNAIYGFGPSGSHRAEVQGAEGQEMADPPKLGPGEAAIHGAANYTIYQEERVGFLYKALEQLKRIAGGVIREVGKEHFGG